MLFRDIILGFIFRMRYENEGRLKMDRHRPLKFERNLIFKPYNDAVLHRFAIGVRFLFILAWY